MIYLHRSGKRQEILTCCLTDPVIDISIHEAEVMIIKIKWLICDVIKDFLGCARFPQIWAVLK